MLKESLDEENAGKKSDHEHIYQSYESTIYALTAAIDTKDHYTFGHSNNVAYYATSLAKALNYTTEMVEIIRQAALLHDVGKIGIPEHILNKEGKLTDEEYEIMKGHVEASIGSSVTFRHWIMLSLQLSVITNVMTETAIQGESREKISRHLQGSSASQIPLMP